MYLALAGLGETQLRQKIHHVCVGGGVSSERRADFPLWAPLCDAASHIQYIVNKSQYIV